MRFTKIPLIATLMAVALSLLIVLPALGQTSGYDNTRGSLSGGADLTVSVLDDDSTDVANSYFNGNLYVSNAGKYDEETGARTGGAHNRVMIAATTDIVREVFPGADGEETSLAADVDPADNVNEANYANDNFACDAKAKVKNNTTGREITVWMDASTLNTLATPPDDTTPRTAVTAIFEVISSGEEKRDGTCTSPVTGGPSSQGTPVPNTDPVQYTFDTLDANVAEVVGRIPARHGDTLTITVTGVSGSVILTVDAKGPEFTEISPEDGATLSSQTVKFRFVVTDSDSGLAHDGELTGSPDADPEAVNGDDDNFTTGEPLASSDGDSRDVKVYLDGVDQSVSGSSGWRQRGARPGVSYFLDMAVTRVGERGHKWYLEATDRAGNTKRTKASDKEPDFTLTVDVSSPEFRDARTGISYDAGKKKEVVNRSFIAVTFEDGNNVLDAVKDIDVDKFEVEDAEVVGFIHLVDKYVAAKVDDAGVETAPCTPKDIDGNCIDQTPQARVYLELAEPLAPDATPQVSMFGGAALDLAGNPSNQDEIVAADNIAPGITVTLATDVTGRPVIRNNGELTVNITSDEELRRLPRVYFAEVVDSDNNSTKDKLDLELGNIRPGDRVTTDVNADNTWAQTYNNGDIGARDGLFAVVVIAEDDADNVGATSGWSRARKTKAPETGGGATLTDLESAGLLVEIDTDTDFATPPFSLAPQAGEDETESNNPFITIDFGAEKNEYASGNDFFKPDSHSAVAIVSITLNGNDVMENTAAVGNNKYTLAAQDLAIGEYELKVTGRDDVGNEVSDSYEFEVAARKAYKINLTPGWNLVSLPGTPLDSSIGSVMGDSMQATIVLAYQDDAWLSAVNDNGTWRGTLTDIVGGYGYWVQTTAFESISALIPETDTSSVLPTAKVIKGWNLLGVVDVLQNGAGDPPSGGSEADNYFKNFDWKVAYSFDTGNNQWSKAIPTEGTGDEIINGKGYWVWSTEAGTLVP